ncbi:uncharacterized protein F4822DRAFT_445141, partial [Hypoxylon trugodes]|uniref:uncharacterized protein n=1 Tax=Hypoxylon trugodes TaxID=326681 RepID=UPI00219C1320
HVVIRLRDSDLEFCVRITALPHLQSLPAFKSHPQVLYYSANMGCFGVLSSFLRKEKRDESQRGYRLRERAVYRQRPNSSLPRPPPPTRHHEGSRTHSEWWEDVDEWERRREYARIVAEAPPINEDFICYQRSETHRDSVLAARGEKVADRHPRRPPQPRVWFYDMLKNCTCQFCSTEQPEHCVLIEALEAKLTRDFIESQKPVKRPVKRVATPEVKHEIYRQLDQRKYEEPDLLKERCSSDPFGDDGEPSEMHEESPEQAIGNVNVNREDQNKPRAKRIHRKSVQNTLKTDDPIITVKDVPKRRRQSQ